VLLTQKKLEAGKFQKLFFVFHDFHSGPPPFFAGICLL